MPLRMKIGPKIYARGLTVAIAWSIHKGDACAHKPIAYAEQSATADLFHTWKIGPQSDGFPGRKIATQMLKFIGCALERIFT